MFVWKADRLLLIERGKPPFGFAVPAGHVDGDATFEDAARRELKEEVGLNAERLELIGGGIKKNPCRREDGNWHEWKIYNVSVTGDINRSADETKRAEWYGREKINNLAQRTERYLKKEVSEAEWEKNPGLEPIMYEWFKELKII